MSAVEPDPFVGAAETVADPTTTPAEPIAPKEPAALLSADTESATSPSPGIDVGSAHGVERRLERPEIRGRRSGLFGVVVANHRPEPVQVRVSTNDPDGSLRVDIPTPSIDLDAGASGRLDVRVSSPKRGPLFVNRRLRLDVTVEVDTTDAQVLTATFVQVPLVTPPVMAAGGLVIVAALAVAQAGLLGGRQAATASPLPSTIAAASLGPSIAPTQPAVATWASDMGQIMSFGGSLGRTTPTPDGLAEVQKFEGGAVYRIKASGVVAPIYGALRENWVNRGGPPPQLGYPIAKELLIEPNQPYEEFERGYLLCVPNPVPGCAVYMTKPVFRAWADFRGQLGYPIQDVDARSGITGAKFERGVIYERSSGDAVVCTRSGEDVTVIAPLPAPAGSRTICVNFK
jgi:hypothetical protein